MGKDRKRVGIGVAPVCTDYDFSTLIQAVAGDLRGNTIRKANRDVQWLDKVTMSEPEYSGTVVAGRRLRPAPFSLFSYAPPKLSHIHCARFWGHVLFSWLPAKGGAWNQQNMLSFLDLELDSSRQVRKQAPA